MERIAYAIVREPLNPRTAIRGTLEVPADGIRGDVLLERLRLRGYVPDGLPAIVSRRHGLVADPQAAILLPGDYVIVSPSVHGMDPISITLLLLAPLILSAYSTVAALQAMKRLKAQDPTSGQAAQTQAYSFGAVENTQIDSVPIPVLYGKTKLGGVVLNRFLYAPEGAAIEYARVLIGLAEGELTEVAPAGATDIYVDNTTLDTYSDYQYETRLGTLDQEPVSFFDEVYQQSFPDLLVTNSLSFYAPLDNDSFENAALCLPEADSTSTACYSGYAKNAYFTTYAGQKCLLLAAETSDVRYGYKTSYLADAYSDPIAIHAWIHVTAAQWNASDVGNLIIWTDCPFEDELQRQYRVGVTKQSATTWVLRLYASYYDMQEEDWFTSLLYDSTEMQSSALVEAWHHVYWFRSGSQFGCFLDGVDVTDRETAYVSKRDSRLYGYRKGTEVSKNRCHIGWDENVPDADSLIGYVKQVAVHIGSVPYLSDFTPPDIGANYLELYTEPAQCACTIHGAADSIHWSYRLPSGLIGYYKNTQVQTPWHARLQEWIELSDGSEILLCDRDYAGGIGQVTSTDITGLFTGVVTWSRTFRFDYVPIESVSGTFHYGEYVRTATGSGYAKIAGIKYSGGTAVRLYLSEIQGESDFSAGRSITGQSSGATATIGSGGIVIAEVVEDPILHIRKASTSYTSSMEFSNVTRLYSVAASRRLSLAYPGTALLGLQIAAQEKLSQVPSVNVICSRMTAELPYWTGSEYGTFEADLSNPAWAAWDLMTNGRYGLGIDARDMDRDSWIEWANYCDVLVPIPGSSETERRASVNVVFDEKNKNGWELLDQIFQIGRAIHVQHGSTHYVRLDCPRDPVMHVSSAMCISGSVKVEWLDPQTKPDRVIIEYLDEDKQYVKQAQSAESEGYDSTENEYRKVDSVFVPAITRAGQARREAIFRLQKQRAAIKRYAWDMDIEAVCLEVGDVVTLQSGSNRFVYGGVIRGVDGTSVTLDKTVLLRESVYGAGTPAVLRSRALRTDAAIEVELTGPYDVETQTITIAQATSGLEAGAPYAIARAEDADLVEIDSISVTDEGKIRITGTLYDPDAYYHDDYGETPI